MEIAIRRAALVDEAAIRQAIAASLHEQHELLKALRVKHSYEIAVRMTTENFTAHVGETCSAIVGRRDCALIEAIVKASDVNDAMEVASRLRLLTPSTLKWRGERPPDFLQAFADGLDATRHRRQHDIGQRIVREIMVEQQHLGVFGEHGGMLTPASLTTPSARGMLSSAEVARLRAGEAIVLDPPQSSPRPHPALSDACMRIVHADLMRLTRLAAHASSSPCNSGALSTAIPLGATGGGFGVADETRSLLWLLAALPAEIERHGWPRKLAVPPLLQLSCYTAQAKARYTPHLDRWENEVHNRRELTILCYVNPGWDESIHGGCLRLHLPSATTDAAEAEARAALEHELAEKATRASAATAAEVAKAGSCRGDESITQGVHALAAALDCSSVKLDTLCLGGLDAQPAATPPPPVAPPQPKFDWNVPVWPDLPLQHSKPHHPAKAGISNTVDVAPIGGRIIIFPSATMMHEVLPCKGGAERLALTLWVEYA